MLCSKYFLQVLKEQPRQNSMTDNRETRKWCDQVKVDNARKIMGAITKLENDIHKSEEKKFWRPMKVPFTLQEGLENVTKDELVHIRQFFDISNASKLKKAELVELLKERLPGLLKEVVRRIDEEQFQFLIETARRGEVPADQASFSQLQFWRQTGLLFTGTAEDRKVVAVPKDLIEAILALEQDPEVKRKIKRNTEWLKLTNGLLYYYGTLKHTQLISMLMQYTGTTEETFDAFDYYTVIHHMQGIYGTFYVNEDGYSHHLVLDSNWVLAEQQKRRDIPYYSFKKEQLLQAGETGFVDRNNMYNKLVQTLEKKHQLEFEKADRIVHEVIVAVKNGKSTSEIVGEFNREILFESIEAIQPVMNQLMDVMNHTRQWILKGFTPAEILEKERKQQKIIQKVSKKESKKLVRRKKIGRNDPCPCGSGKKYKKCHGR